MGLVKHLTFHPFFSTKQLFLKSQIQLNLQSDINKVQALRPLQTQQLVELLQVGPAGIQSASHRVHSGESFSEPLE